jgi:cation:H+ antiporter
MGLGAVLSDSASQLVQSCAQFTSNGPGNKLLLANINIPSSNWVPLFSDSKTLFMLLDVAIVIFGFIALIWGADKFVAGASAIAFNFGVAPLMIGLTIVAIGTSAPEFFSSAVAAIENQAPIAIGNALGSNLFNIGVALGVATLIRPITPPGSLVRRELPVLLIVTVVTGLVFANLYIGIIDSLVLLALLALCVYALVRRGLRGEAAPALVDPEEETDIPAISTTRACLRLLIGLVLLIIGAETLVGGASSIAERLGVSSAIIGLTIVALGTSLPELAACVTSVLRGHSDLALGNVVGSNILNLLVVLPFPGLLAAGPIEQELFYRDYATMLAMTLVLAGTCFWTIKSGKRIGRSFGIVFLLMYALWFSIMYQQI